MVESITAGSRSPRYRLERPRRGRGALLAAGAAAGVAVLGFVGSTSPAALVAGAGGLVLGGVVFLRPEIGALLLVVTAEIVPASVLEARGIPMGGGRIEVTDVLVGLSVGGWLVSLAVARRRPQLPSPFLSYLLLSFFGLAGVSLTVAHASGIPLKESLTELRPLLAYLIVFPLVGCVRRRPDLLRGAAIVVAGLGISSLVLLVRYASGTNELATGTGGALRIRATTDLVPLLTVVCGIVFICLRPPGRRALPVLLTSVGAAALYVTFLRGAWLAAALALSAVVLLLPGRLRGWAVLRAAILVLCAAVALFAASSLFSTGDPASAAVARIGTLLHTGQDVSAEHRLAEWHEATRQIASHPLTGIGLGGTITFVTPLYNAAELASGVHFTTSYIHSSYLWLALKLGIPGACALLAAVLYALSSAIALYRRSTDAQERQILLAVAGSLIATLAFAVTGPHLTVLNSTPLVAALVAVPELIRRFRNDDARAGR